jgi:hypothetical protein
MDDAVPFAAILLVLAVIAMSLLNQQFLLAVALGIAAVGILIFRAIELA